VKNLFESFPPGTSRTAPRVCYALWIGSIEVIHLTGRTSAAAMPANETEGMRVLVNAASANTGGAVTYLTNFLGQLAALTQDDRLSIIAPSTTIERLETNFENPALLPISYEYPPNRDLRRIFFDQFRVPQLARRCRSELLFSANGFGSIFSPCPQLLLVRNSIYFCPTYEAKVRELGNSLRAVRLRRTMSIASIRAADVVMFPTRAMRDLVMSNVGLEGKETRCLHYGFNRETFFREGAPVPPVAPRIRAWKDDGHDILLAVSAYAVHKNLETLVEAMPALLAAGRKIKLVMTISRESTGEPDGYDALIRRVGELDLEEVVYPVGPVPYEQLQHVYAVADVFVFPSFTESFGQTMVEAMASGLPIAAADVPVNREVLADAAIFFETSNSASCAREIERLLTEPGLSEGLSDRGLERSKRFSWSRYTRELLDIFRELCSRN